MWFGTKIELHFLYISHILEFILIAELKYKKSKTKIILISHNVTIRLSEEI